MSRWYIKPNGRASADRGKFYSSNEFIGVIKKAEEIMGTKREDGGCFDGGTCGLGGFCDHCPLINNDETENFEALSCANESIGNLKDQIAALKEENERLKSQQKPVAWVWVSEGNQFTDNFPAYSFNGIERLSAGKHNLYLSPPAEAEEISVLKARVEELEDVAPIVGNCPYDEEGCGKVYRRGFVCRCQRCSDDEHIEASYEPKY